MIPARARALLLALSLGSIGPWQAVAQNQPKATFRFSQEAGSALQAMWRESVASREERVACLASTIRSDTVYVTRVSALEPEEADSMGISATRSVEHCGPPTWSGTVHTHIAMYSDSLPSTRFSAQDRTAMRLWYDRWHADGVFCLIYSARDAHCEADGVVGGMRSQPRVVNQ
ncbi:MAG TPA: hypothetical protein VJU17_09485 [Gemmatimonadales bacterium]|nr:hypothetical protein [Gemmatimonadales bacterium]